MEGYVATVPSEPQGYSVYLHQLGDVVNDPVLEKLTLKAFSDDEAVYESMEGTESSDTDFDDHLLLPPPRTPRRKCRSGSDPGSTIPPQMRMKTPSPRLDDLKRTSEDTDLWDLWYEQALRKEDLQERREAIQQLFSEFQRTAQRYGEIIITEKGFPDSQKTIKPVCGRGVAGGQKFLIRNLLFKFAVDVRLPGSNMWLYGGDEPNDLAAAKAAGNEMKALEAVLASGSGLRAPLMCIVDWAGHRLTAQAFLSLDRDSLVCGSSDGGRTIVASPECDPMLEMLADSLCLARHEVERRDGSGTRVPLYTAVDVEIHRGKNGKFYALDLARLCPPQLPSGPGQGRDIFSKVFRPEFLTAYDGPPLSGDALSNFGLINGAAHARNIQLAGKYLHEVLIPRVAERLSPHQTFSAQLHAWGVNVRFLALVRYYVTNTVLRRRIFLELVARSIAREVRSSWRKELQKSPEHTVVTVLDWARKLSREETLQLVGKHFVGGEEAPESERLVKPQDPNVLDRVAELLGCELTLQFATAYIGGNKLSPVDVRLKSRIKSMSVALLAEAYNSSTLSSSSPSLLRHTVECFRTALLRTPSSQSARSGLFQALCGLMSATLGLEDTAEWDQLMDEARSVLRDCPTDHSKADCERAEHALEELLERQAEAIAQATKSSLASSDDDVERQGEDMREHALLVCSLDSVTVEVARLLRRHHGLAVTVALFEQRNEGNFAAKRALVLPEVERVVEIKDLVDEYSSRPDGKLPFTTILVLPLWHDAPDSQAALLENASLSAGLPVHRPGEILQQLLPLVQASARVGCFCHALGSLEEVGSTAMLPARMMGSSTAMTIRCLGQTAECLLTGIACGGPYMPGVYEEHWQSSLRLVGDTADAVADRLVRLLLEATPESQGRVIGRSGECLAF